MRISVWSSDVCSSDLDQAIEELVHPRSAQRDLAADRHALAQLELRDRLLRLGDDGLLAGDQLHFLGCLLDLLLVLRRLAHTHVEDALVDPWHFERRSEEHTSKHKSRLRSSYAG